MFTYLIMDLSLLSLLKSHVWRSRAPSGRGTPHTRAQTHTPAVCVLSIPLAVETAGDSRPHVLVHIQTHRHTLGFVLIVLEVSGPHWRHVGRGKAVSPSDGSSVSPLLLSVISCFVSLLGTFSGRTQHI